jgi:hypothetical protein
MALGERKAGEAILDVLLDVLGDLRITLPVPLLGHRTGEAQSRFLAGAAKSARRSAASSLRLATPTIPRRFLA